MRLNYTYQSSLSVFFQLEWVTRETLSGVGGLMGEPHVFITHMHCCWSVDLSCWGKAAAGVLITVPSLRSSFSSDSWERMCVCVQLCDKESQLLHVILVTSLLVIFPSRLPALRGPALDGESVLWRLHSQPPHWQEPISCNTFPTGSVSLLEPRLLQVLANSNVLEPLCGDFSISGNGWLGYWTIFPKLIKQLKMLDLILKLPSFKNLGTTKFKEWPGLNSRGIKPRQVISRQAAFVLRSFC